MASSQGWPDGSVIAETYKLVRVIHAGGRGDVYEAALVADETKKVALKLYAMPSRESADKRVGEALDKARTALGDTKSVCVGKAHGKDEAAKALFVESELLEGTSLEAAQGDAEGEAKEARKFALSMVETIGDALGKLHDQGLAHGEVRPRKVFFRKEPVSGSRFVLLDVGAAAAWLTIGGEGKAPVLAPELRAEGKVPTAAGDVWALGLLAFFAFVGKRFFEDEPPKGALVSAAARAKELGLAERVPLAFEPWFAKCTDEDPEKRYADGREAAAALIDVLGGPLSNPRAMPQIHAPDTPKPAVLVDLPPPKSSSSWITAPPVWKASSGGATSTPDPDLPPSSKAFPIPRSQARVTRASVAGWLTAGTACFAALTIGFVAFAARAWHQAPIIQNPAIQRPTEAEAEQSEPDCPIPVSNKDPSEGNRDALVTIVLFGDYDEATARAETEIATVRQKYKDDEVRLVWKHGKEGSPLAPQGVAAFELGGAKGFWNVHRQLEQDRRIGALPFDKETFDSASASRVCLEKVLRDVMLGRALGVDAPPVAFVNGIDVKFGGSANLATVVANELEDAKKAVAQGSAKASIYSERTLKNFRPKLSSADAPAGDTTVYDVPIDDSPSRGKIGAYVTVVEFADFQCPFCSRAAATLQRLEQAHPQDIRVVWKNRPLAMHPRAEPAAEFALEARKEKGDAAFWFAHDILFGRRGALEDSDLERYAGELGIDPARVSLALVDHRHKADIDRDQKLGDTLSVNGTPAFFFNGVRLIGAQPYDAFEAAFNEAYERAKKAVKPATSAEDVYSTVIKASKSSP